MFDISSMPSGEIKLLILTNRRPVTDVIAAFKKNYPHVFFSITHEDYAAYENYGKFDIIIADRNIDSDLFEIRDFVREYLKMGLGVALFPSVSWQGQLDENIKLIRIGDGIYRSSHLYVNKTSSSITKMFAQTLELYLFDN